MRRGRFASGFLGGTYGWRSIQTHLPPLNFISIHYAYFIVTSLVSSIIFWGASTPPRSVKFFDALFLCISAMTLAGLNTINLSTLNTFQQVILFLLTLLGSAILVSIAVVHVRKKAFKRKFKHVIARERERRKAGKASGRDEESPRFSFTKRRSSTNVKPEVDGVVVRGRPIRSAESENAQGDTARMGNPGDRPPPDMEQRYTIETAIAREDFKDSPNDRNQLAESNQREEGSAISLQNSLHIQFAAPLSPLTQRRHTRVLSFSGVGARPDIMNHPKKAHAPAYPIPLAALTMDSKLVASQSTSKYFKSGGFIGRNSQFHSLTLAERERLGGVEYRAVTLLEVIVPLYFLLWQLLPCIGIGAWIAVNRADTATQNGLNPWWVGAFNGVSAFNNSGMSLLDANMVAFQDCPYLIVTMGLMVLAGNTCYPIFLRFILWSLLKITARMPRFAEMQKTLGFLLDHPRRCYTNLFPSIHTWWLLGILVILNGTDWLAFEVLNIGNTSITSLSTRTRILAGLFQALAVRSGGFYVVNIPQLRIGLLVLYVIMMYISVYPVVITMRNSNIYEERSLGIYWDDPPQKEPDTPQYAKIIGGLKRRLTRRDGSASQTPERRSYFVRQQLRGQLAHDLWWIVLAVFFIIVIEASQFEADPVAYSVFNVIFEVISAYGCVGISVGLPGEAYSFCGGWHVLSKLILCAVMIRGRHRGLPVAIDQAVLLPGEELGLAEEEDALIRLDKVGSMGKGSVAARGGG